MVGISTEMLEQTKTDIFLVKTHIQPITQQVVEYSAQQLVTLIITHI
jgi:hypothetical protein